MCGIAGIVRFDDEPIERRRLEAMLAHIRHRGPDDESITQLDRCGLAHARLSIVDIDRGRQPMSVPAIHDRGALTVIFNGEIYNHRALRRRLERFGHKFATGHSDTEVLLHGYRQWGDQLPKHLSGMFAFVIWDAQERTLFACRDRVGKKPLYLRWRHAKGRPVELTFASLIGAILAGSPSNDKPRIDPRAMLAYLRLGYTQDRTLIEGVGELHPGHWLRIDGQGNACTEAYWRPPPVSLSTRSHGVIDAVRELIEDAVAARLEADAPLGAFLSGGIDSSITAAMAMRHLRSHGAAPLRTFTVRMADSEYDESAFAAQVAQHIGSAHTVLNADPAGDLIADLRKLIAIYGEPTADSSILPTYWLSKVTRQHVKVALSGDGGDELFGGYDRYRAMRVLTRNRWWMRHGPADLLDDPNPRSLTARTRRLLMAARRQEPVDQYLSMIHLFTDEQIKALGFDVHAYDDADHPSLPPHNSWPTGMSPAKAAMRWDFEHYLPNDLLRKVDRASMAVGLEVRCPLLDTQVCELASHLRARSLMPGGRPKAILRDIASTLLPSAIAQRPKRGFAIPVGKWFRGPLQQALRDSVVAGTIDALGLFRFEVEHMIEEHVEQRVDHTHRLFGLLTLSLWADWIKNPTPITAPV